MQKLNTILQTIETCLTKLQDAALPTPPLTIISASHTSGPDESSHTLIICQENEHFITAYNKTQAEDSDSDDAHDYLQKVSQALFPALLSELNTLKRRSPLIQIDLPTGLHHIATDPHSNCLTMHTSDNLYYISYTDLGQD